MTRGIYDHSNRCWKPQFKLVDAPSHMPENSLPCKIAINCSHMTAQLYNRKQMQTPKRMCCMHICDRGPGSKEADGSQSIGICCEPTHLKNGTYKDNRIDASKKGRLKTIRHSHKRRCNGFWNIEKDNLIDFLQKGMSPKQIAVYYNVSTTTLYNVLCKFQINTVAIRRESKNVNN